MTKLSSDTTSSPKIIRWSISALKYLVVVLLIYSAVNWWRQPVMPVDAPLKLTNYQGEVVDLKSLSTKKPTLVYFWGSWCGVCSITSKTVNNLSESGYSVVTIAVKSGDNAELQSYLQKKNLGFDVVNDENGTIFDNWQGQVTPSYIILNEGKATQGLVGIQPLWSLKLRLFLSSL